MENRKFEIKNKKKINRLKQFGNNRYSLSYIDMVNYSNEFKKIKLNNNLWDFYCICLIFQKHFILI